MRQFKTVIFALSAVSLIALIAACGSGQNKLRDTGTSDTGSPEDTTTDTGTEDTGADTAEPSPDTTGDTADAGRDRCLDQESDDAIPLNYFKYVEKKEGGLATESGVRVSLSGQQLRITKIEANTTSCELDCQDARDIKQELLDQSVREKLHPDRDPTFECGSDDGEGTQHRFEAKLGTTLDAPEPLVTVTGCMAAGSTQPDADLVQTITDTLMDTRTTYFDERECHRSQ